ncbi:MAG: hypothetical protein AB1779_09930 [Candidatus Thermoplasmatota archaeon]
MEIAKKDVKFAYRYVLFSFFIGFLFFILVLISASTLTPKSFVWDYTLLNSFYGFAIIIYLLVSSFVFNYTYGKEIREGTIRTIALYPIGLNFFSLAKILSTLFLSSLVCVAFYVIPLSPLALYGLVKFGDIFLVYIVTGAVTFYILLISLFLFHILSYYEIGNSYPNNIFIALLIFFGLMTEAVSRAIGIFVIHVIGNIANVGTYEIEGMIWNLYRTTETTSIFSPYHLGGNILSFFFISYNAWEWEAIFFIGLIIVFLGLILGRKLYWDIFIRVER